ncbi:MAG: hypothetical protein EP348_01575 [Alphaproteobacteria bacterium]|nr:MAG: hypothetical protein EP348_01575 [Alphaproteobacteria bacterium]
MNSPAPVATNTTPAAVVTPSAATSSIRAGELQFVIKPSGVGNYSGWQVQILQAGNIWGFKPFTSRKLNASESLSVALYPGSYFVKVLLNGRDEQAYGVLISSGSISTIEVDVGYFSNDITLYNNPADQSHAYKYVIYKQPIDLMFDPVTIVLPGDLIGKYEGPRVGQTPTGEGLFRIFRQTGHKYKGLDLIATIPDAKAEDGHLSGELIFTDGRAVDGKMDANYNLPEGTTARWPDGSVFKGQYLGPEPSNGTLTLADGTVWTGPMQGKAPQGPGTLIRPDGTRIEKAPGGDIARYNGKFPCTDANGTAGSCYFFKGQATDAETYAQKQADEEMRQKAIAEANAAKAEEERKKKEARKNQSANSSSASSGADGCSKVSGTFEADQGLSRLTFESSGKGHLWQHTYGGTTSYTFDIDFRYKGTRNSMRFDYGPGTYKDASGRVVKRVNIAGGGSSCTYNGRSISINGKEYIRR